MSQDTVSIVDENDNVLGTKARDELAPKDIIRVSVLWIENSQGKVLLQQRALTKRIGPGQWGPAVAGTVESHETYLTNIIKETEEELGLKSLVPGEVGKRMYWEPDGQFGRMFMFYKALVDKNIDEFTIQKEEVAQLKWVDKGPLTEEVKKNSKKYVPSSIFWKEIYY